MDDRSRDGCRRPTQTDVLAVFDGYEKYMAAAKGDTPTDVELEARLINSLVKAHGPATRLLAVVHHDDKLRQAAYKRVGCLVHSMNGDRPAELTSLIGDEVDQMIQDPPRKLIIMGDDAAYGPLCALACSRESEVLVWPLNGPAVAPQLEPYVVQLLGDLLPDLRTQAAVVMVKLDVENHLYSMKQAGKVVDTEVYLAALQMTLAGLGDVMSIQAIADWKRLRESLGRDYQWEFEDNGVRTEYRRNIPGKNTSDVALAGSIHESLARDPRVDVYVIGTGDGDFTPVVEAIHSRGKQVYVIGMRASMSRALAELADGVRYLDDYLDGPTVSQPPATNADHRAVATDLPPVRALATVLQVVDFLGRRNWAYAYFNRLPESIDKVQVRAMIDRGLLQPRAIGERNTVALNPEHPLAQQAQLLMHWLRRRLQYRLGELHMSYLDTNLLVRDMQDDPHCRAAQLGQTQGEAAAWLEAAAVAGFVVKKRQSNPKNPDREIDTWWPRPVQTPVAAAAPAEPDTFMALKARPGVTKPGKAEY